MAKAKNDLTADQVRQMFIYEPETGIIRRRYKFSPKALPAGSEDGKPTTRGYISVTVVREGVRRRYFAHRLAVLYMTGEWPPVVDHRDGDGGNNRWANLRVATQSQNLANRKVLNKNNTSGYHGVSLTRNGRYKAQLSINKKVTFLGNYATAEQASAVYKAAAKRHFGEFARCP